MFGSLFDAYTVRKIAPRLLVAVIGINLSIYLCVAVVDITNIIGGGLGDLLREPFHNSAAFSNPEIPFTKGTKVAIGGVGVVGAVGTAVGGLGFLGAVSGGIFGLVGGALYALLAFLLISMLSVALIALAIAATVIIRYGAIMILTVISPVAIALLVLPGTEKYFKQWWDIFMKVLIMYPIIAVIFAMSDILGSVLMVTLVQKGGATALVTIAVVILALYAPLFMIPFAFKLAGGVIGGVYDFANKQRGSMVESRQKKARENPESMYNKLKNKSHDARSRGNVTGEQLKKGVSAFGSTVRNRRGEGLGARQLLREAGGQFNKEGTRVHGKHVLAKALEVEENDSDLKATVGSDDFGKAQRAYIVARQTGSTHAEAQALASEALRASNGDQYQYERVFDADGNEHADTAGASDAALAQRRRSHDNMLNLAQTSRSRYGNDVALLHGAMQDHASGTGSDETQMVDDIVRLSHGDTNMDVALTNAFRERAEKANRKEKSKIGFSTSLQLTQARREGRVNNQDLSDQFIYAFLDRASAGEIGTAHVNTIAASRDRLLDRVQRHATNQDGSQRTREELDADFEYGRAVKQAADFYDILQHQSPDQLQRLEGRHASQNVAAADQGFMELELAGPGGGNLRSEVESYRTGRTVLTPSQLQARTGSALPPTAAELDAVNQNENRVFQPGTRGVEGFRTGRRDYGQDEAAAAGANPANPGGPPQVP